MFNLLYRLLANSMAILTRLTRLEGWAKDILTEQAVQRSMLEALGATLARIEGLVTPPPGAVHVVFSVTIDGKTQVGVESMKIKDSQEFEVSLSFTDAGGNPASVQGAPTWTVDNTSALTVTAAADGLSAIVSANGPVGTAQVSVSADADLGEGTTTITGVLDVEVIAGDATLVVLNPGPAREKGAAPPAP